MSDKRVQLSHGGGGREMAELINKLFFDAFDNPILRREEDAACLPLGGDCAFTTDSFTVAPLFFKGGDIGKLAIAGTVNDLAMMGAEPQYLSCGFIIEEGFEISRLKQIVASMADALSQCGARIVCGDTKVVPKGCADGIFINTSGVGRILKPGISAHALRNGDAILLSRDIGRHGAAILSAREGLELESELSSDCAVLWNVVEQLIAANLEIHAMRDATRGGLSAVLNEWAKASNKGITLRETAIPVCDEVRGVCELYGFEPWDLANEGSFVVALPRELAEGAVEIMRRFGHCDQACIIGEVGEQHPGKVVLESAWGSRRYLDLPQGELLPRIC
ncbi:MAG: hydrogenase expression/formation protein HypE [Shewanella algae]|uniref:Hydrogenase expression/formation protein HypE n=2 Tax=Unclassified Bacteria TaxID=49928 RepID=A0AAU6VWF2_UNCXX|nr:MULTISPECIES: hydrogenase expression/formation protein HypE [Shewanella]AXQ15966.1 hydrogenase expression/formation protein HypE [Shewanella algae]EKT4486783.1 hydrogenase expression/formation protein HypE [Shewanella algae]MBO2547991.1 hydrogenase expression/formation protein HypE [Shewanella algae]MBO2565384.1 hydrogenase expression/formation protein HypE [Shewanella algae]MBO2633072.1 hydrogenase expression/formation protein HypE [Shewanella algae]